MKQNRLAKLIVAAGLLVVAAVPSSALGASTPANTAAPTITGTAEVDSTLTANEGTWTGDPTPTYTYQWQTCEAANAPTATVIGSSLNSPTGVAVDSAGNVYTANTGSDTITRITPGGTATTFASTGDGPQTIAIDDADNLYVSNTTGNSVSKITPDGTSEILASVTGTSPQGIAVDSTGNVYTANSGSNNVTKITPGGTATTLGATGSQPLGLVLDSAGNVFTANRLSNNITKITPGGEATTPFASIPGTSPTPQPWGLAIDDSDNLYTANYSGGFNGSVSKITAAGVVTNFGNTGAGPRWIARDSSGNLYTTNTTSEDVTKLTPAGVRSTLDTGFQTFGIAVDSAGDIYVTSSVDGNVSKFVLTTCADIPSATDPTYTPVAGDSGKKIRVVVTATNPSGSATANSATTSGIASTPANTEVPGVTGTAKVGETLTASNGTWTGFPTPAFTYRWLSCDSAGANCTAISGATESTYTPTSSDTGRKIKAEVTATNSTGSDSSTSAPTGVVEGPPSSSTPPSVSGTPEVGSTLTANEGTWSGYPEPTYSYQWQRCTGPSSTTFATVGDAPRGITIDPAGNVYTANVNSDNVSKVTPGGTSSTFGAVGDRPYEPVLDSTGNLYTVNFGDDNVSKLLPNGSAAGSPWPVSTNLDPTSIAIDGSNNLYTTNFGNAGAPGNTITKIAPSGTTEAFTVPGTNPNPLALTLDAAGNIYVANYGNNTVAKLLPNGTAAGGNWPVSLDSGAEPAGITLDSAGNVFVTNLGLDKVTKITPAGVASDFASTGDSPRYTVTDEFDNVYTANNGSDNVTKITPGGTPSLLATVGDNPQGMVFDSEGFLFVANLGSDTISRIDPNTCTDISGADDPTYTLTGEDEGKQVRVKVTATNSEGSSTANSEVTETVEPAPIPSNTSPPTISGETEVPQTLTADKGTWTGEPTFEYQWQRCTGDIGVKWTAQTPASNSSIWTSIAWGGPKGQEKFVATGLSGAVMTSPDGVDWTTRTPAAANNWISVTWGGQPGEEKFVAVADSGTGNRVMTSPDGINWTARSSTADNNWYSVTWGGPEGQEKFVAVAASGSGNRVMTSPDGITWTARTSAANNFWVSVVWGGPAGQEKFVAVAFSGTGNRVMTSPDGFTWTAQSSASDNDWIAVTWGGPAGQEKFVAVGATGTGNRVMTSPDGITWTSQTPPADNTWAAITWGGPEGEEQFVATADTGSDQRVMTSPDGVNWTLRATPADTGWRAVTWGGPAGDEKFVAVSNFGTGDRAMTSGLDCVDIDGATEEDYILTGDDEGARIRVVVTATNDAGSTAAFSDLTAAIDPEPVFPPENTESPAVSGVAQQGQTLTADPGNWTGNPEPELSYQWQRCEQGDPVSSILGTTGNLPTELIRDEEGNIYTANLAGNNVSKITPGGVTSTVGTTGNEPNSLVRDSAGNIYTSNQAANTVTKITAGGSSSVFSPTGFLPRAIVADDAGNLYTPNQNGGNVTKIAPDGTPSGSSPFYAWAATGPGTSPIAAVFDEAGNLYVANSGANNVTKITPDGTASVFANTGDFPYDITIDREGNLYTSNVNSQTVTKITPAGETSTLGTTGGGPVGIAVDGAGNVYTSNQNDNTVSLITPFGVSSTYASTGSTPRAVIVDEEGVLYTANFSSNDVSKIVPGELNCSDIDGATEEEYTAQAADVGKKLRVKVTATNSEGSETVESQPTATVVPDEVALTITKSGGTITSEPEGIDCGNTCTANFPFNEEVTLIATPDADKAFDATASECPGQGWDFDGDAYRCTVKADQALDVSISFRSPKTIWVNSGSTGAGGSCETPEYNTVGAAENAAIDGDTIRICEGEFTGASSDKDLTYEGEGPGKTVIVGSGEDNEGFYFNATSSTVRNLTIRGTSGGIFIGGQEETLSVANVSFEDNSGFRGAGIQAYGTSVEVSSSTFTGNSAVSGSAIWAFGPVTVVNSTISGNSKSNLVGRGTAGGFVPDPSTEGGMIVTNTFDGSEARNDITLLNVTLADNDLGESPSLLTLCEGEGPCPEGDEYPSGDIDVTNSIIAEDGTGCFTPYSGEVVSGGGNVIQNTTTGCDDLISGPPAPDDRVSASALALQPLTVNPPGDTATMALASSSVARGAAVSAECPETDQRGVTRPSSGCDSGAYQSAATPPPSGKPKIKVAVKAPKKVKAGRKFTIRVKTTNRAKNQTTRATRAAAPTTATKVKTCVTLPGGVFVVNARGGKVSGRKVCWTKKSLAAGKSVNYSVVVRSSSTASGTERISVSATASNSSGATAKAKAKSKVRVIKPKPNPKPKPPTG